jgi:hypothetical protein
MGYLALTSELMYASLGATYANILVGVLSAVVDRRAHVLFMLFVFICV